MSRFSTENIAAAWTTSFQLISPFARLTGLNNASIHWKNKTTTIPRMEYHSEDMSTDGRTDQRTIENSAREKSGENRFLPKVKPVWNLRGVRII